ncbi:Dps family protein [Ulvibacterium marinum]|uniref:DNA starvation/stationary phase protection protein n=1 Tax=Ulvibacterium marinum TaxID=2419782 RepID=A0A3B0C1T8_9FLAO|nr:DNA starvation/stationary phase protection protein [Ulvibacterium marinum]RKN78698.1 DNA starvation/stationary phase protection protein [Ulvibacterium marinum]
METTKTEIGIKKENRKAVVEMLKQILADEHVLYIKTRNAHWNIEGIDFHSKHVFLEEQYNKLETVIDEVAERIRMLGFYAPGTMKQFLETSQLNEEGPEQNNTKGFFSILLEDHDTIIKFIRKNISENAEERNDDGTADFIIALMQKHEQMAWMMRATLKTF